MSSSRNQFFATFFANLLCLSYGLATGWTSAAIPLLQSSETPLEGGRISNDEASLIGSILTIGGLAGTLMFGYASNEFGRKKSIFLIAFPQIIGWILCYLAEDSLLLIIFRLLAGISAGGIFTVVPVFISEISADRVRGLLGSTLWLFFGIGLFLAYVFGAIFPYHLIPWISLPFSIIFLFGFHRVPETPLYLLKIGEVQAAEASLKYYRGSQGDSSEMLDMRVELQSMAQSLTADSSESFSLKDLKEKHPRNALLYGIALMALNQLCGCFPMMNFTSTIFSEAGSTLSPNASSIIVGAVQIVGAVLCTFLVEKAGRKLLLSISSLGISVGLAILSVYTFSTSRGVDLSSFSWIPLASFSFVIFISNLGVNTLPFLYLSEIVPTKTKGFTIAFCLAVLYIIATLVIQFLSTLIELLGMHGTMLFFSINSLIGAVVIVSLLPETKGKNYEEISKLME